MPAILPVGAPSLLSISGEAGRTASAVGTNGPDMEGRSGKEFETFVTQVDDNAGEIGNRGWSSRGNQREWTGSTVLSRMRGRFIGGVTAMLHARVMGMVLRMRR